MSRLIFVNLPGCSFEDPDGHFWEVMWMAAEAAREAMAPAVEPANA